MSLPLANQVRHLYVVSELVSDALPAALGELAVKGEAGKSLWFQHYGQGGLTSSDKIDVDKIRYIKQTANAQMNDSLKNHTIKVTKVAAGQVYEVKLRFLNYIGQGAQDFTYRLGTYRAKTGDNAAAIAAGLASSLQATLGLEQGATATDINNYKEPIATVTVSGDTITVGEVEQYWELGKFPVAQMPIEIGLNGVIINDEYLDFEWATIGEDTPTALTNSGKKIADLEYFCMGWRADEYRGMGYPRNVNTKYMVDPTEDYDLIDIHYFFQGTGVSVQQSEKELTLVVPKGDSSVLAAIAEIVGSNKVVEPDEFPERDAGD